MKVKFLQDYGKYKAGDVVDLPEDVADDLHQAGVAYPYTEPKPAPKKAPAKRAAKK